MTRKELEMVEQLRTRLALHFTDAVLTDVAPPLANAPYNALSKGWTYVGALSEFHARVEIACSSRISHAVGRDDQTTTQRPMWLYSSEVKALKAMRNEVEQQAAKRLRQIDLMIDSAALRELSGGNQASDAKRAVATAASEA